jgi:uncharacterized protein (DUF433 family)
MKESSVVRSDPDILGGTAVFVGTRVPVQALIDYIEGGHSLKEFLDDFPTVLEKLLLQPSSKPRPTRSPTRVLLDECVPRTLRSPRPLSDRMWSFKLTRPRTFPW